MVVVAAAIILCQKRGMEEAQVAVTTSRSFIELVRSEHNGVGVPFHRACLHGACEALSVNHHRRCRTDLMDYSHGSWWDHRQSRNFRRGHNCNMR
jgi:hypothetical protein